MYEEQVVKAYDAASTGNFPKPDLDLIEAAELIKQILAYCSPMDETSCAITVLAVVKHGKRGGTGLIVSPSGGNSKGQRIFNALIGYQYWSGDAHRQFRPYRHWGIYYKKHVNSTTSCGEPKALNALTMAWPGWKVTGYACFWWTTLALTSHHTIRSNHSPNERYMTPCTSCASLVVPT
jgi:hypothetical protein